MMQTLMDEYIIKQKESNIKLIEEYKQEKIKQTEELKQSIDDK